MKKICFCVNFFPIFIAKCFQNDLFCEDFGVYCQINDDWRVFWVNPSAAFRLRPLVGFLSLWWTLFVELIIRIK